MFALAAIAAVPAQAQFQGPGASGRSGTATTVAEASRARTGTRAVLQGNIVERQRRDYFTFEDRTGRMTVEIARPVFRGRTVTTKTRVRLHGLVDRNHRGRYVEVFRLEILN